MKKIPMLDMVDNSIPLYETNLTTVESNTITKIIIAMKISEFFLFRFNERWSVTFLTNTESEDIRKCLYSC